MYKTFLLSKNCKNNVDSLNWTLIDHVNRKCSVPKYPPCKPEVLYTPLQCLAILSSCSPGESCNAEKKATVMVSFP